MRRKQNKRILKEGREVVEQKKKVERVRRE